MIWALWASPFFVFVFEEKELNSLRVFIALIICRAWYNFTRHSQVGVDRIFRIWIVFWYFYEMQINCMTNSIVSILWKYLALVLQNSFSFVIAIASRTIPFDMSSFGTIKFHSANSALTTVSVCASAAPKNGLESTVLKVHSTFYDVTVTQFYLTITKSNIFLLTYSFHSTKNKVVVPVYTYDFFDIFIHTSNKIIWSKPIIHKVTI